MKNRSYLAFLGQRYERMGVGEKTRLFRRLKAQITLAKEGVCV